LLRLCSRLVGAVAAGAADLDDRPRGRETGGLGRLTDAARQAVVVDVNRLPALVANQEDAVVQALGMGIRDISVRALDPSRKVRRYEQVEDPIDAVGGDAASLSARDRLGDIISARGLIETGQGFEHSLAHSGPLLALSGQAVAGSIFQRLAVMDLMIVRAHMSYRQDLDLAATTGKQPRADPRSPED